MTSCARLIEVRELLGGSGNIDVDRVVDVRGMTCDGTPECGITSGESERCKPNIADEFDVLATLNDKERTYVHALVPHLDPEDPLVICQANSDLANRFAVAGEGVAGCPFDPVPSSATPLLEHIYHFIAGPQGRCDGVIGPNTLEQSFQVSHRIAYLTCHPWIQATLAASGCGPFIRVSSVADYKERGIGARALPARIANPNFGMLPLFWV